VSRRAAHFPFFRSLRRLRSAFWRRRVVHWLVRTAWLALLAPTVFLAGYLWLGWQVSWQYWLYPMLAMVLLSMLWAMRPIGLRRIAFRLDERLALRNQLITAYEVSQTTSEADNLVVQRLLQDAVNTVVELRRQVRTFNRLFWLEFQALIGVLVLLGAMLLLDALNPRLPQAIAVDLPPPLAEPAADEVIPPDPQLFPPPFAQLVSAQNPTPEQLQAALEALADALRDRAITRATADALDRGDLAGAADSLRRLADQLGELSAQARAGLGESLQEAADAIGQNAPSLTQPLQRGSQALAGENLQQAAQAVEQLADALDSLQESPQETAQAPTSEPPPESQPEPGPQPGQAESTEAEEAEEAESPQSPEAQGGNGAGAGNEGGEGASQPTEAERLAVEGQPLELESDPELEEGVLQPAELAAEAGEQSTADSPFARSSANANADLGPDPLTYPWDKREIIRRYFTP
jgi:hypothetical protein